MKRLLIAFLSLATVMAALALSSGAYAHGREGHDGSKRYHQDRRHFNGHSDRHFDRRYGKPRHFNDHRYYGNKFHGNKFYGHKDDFFRHRDGRHYWDHKRREWKHRIRHGGTFYFHRDFQGIDRHRHTRDCIRRRWH